MLVLLPFLHFTFPVLGHLHALSCTSLASAVALIYGFSLPIALSLPSSTLLPVARAICRSHRFCHPGAVPLHELLVHALCVALALALPFYLLLSGLLLSLLVLRPLWATLVVPSLCFSSARRSPWGFRSPFSCISFFRSARFADCVACTSCFYLCLCRGIWLWLFASDFHFPVHPLSALSVSCPCFLVGCPSPPLSSLRASLLPLSPFVRSASLLCSSPLGLLVPPACCLFSRFPLGRSLLLVSGSSSLVCSLLLSGALCHDFPGRPRLCLSLAGRFRRYCLAPVWVRSCQFLSPVRFLLTWILLDGLLRTPLRWAFARRPTPPASLRSSSFALLPQLTLLPSLTLGHTRVLHASCLCGLALSFYGYLVSVSVSLVGSVILRFFLFLARFVWFGPPPLAPSAPLLAPLRLFLSPFLQSLRRFRLAGCVLPHSPSPWLRHSRLPCFGFCSRPAARAPLFTGTHLALGTGSSPLP